MPISGGTWWRLLKRQIFTWVLKNDKIVDFQELRQSIGETTYFGCCLRQRKRWFPSRVFKITWFLLYGQICRNVWMLNDSKFENMTNLLWCRRQRSTASFPKWKKQKAKKNLDVLLLQNLWHFWLKTETLRAKLSQLLTTAVYWLNEREQNIEKFSVFAKRYFLTISTFVCSFGGFLIH